MTIGVLSVAVLILYLCVGFQLYYNSLNQRAWDKNIEAWTKHMNIVHARAGTPQEIKR